jgi:hypothetical protein
LFPVVSLALNTFGHANYVVTGVAPTCALAHAEHHRRERGGYGFVLSAVGARRAG